MKHRDTRSVWCCDQWEKEGAKEGRCPSERSSKGLGRETLRDLVEQKTKEKDEKLSQTTYFERALFKTYLSRAFGNAEVDLLDDIWLDWHWDYQMIRVIEV